MGEERRYELPYTLWVPKSNLRFICLQKNGVSKVNQDLSVCFGEKESGGASCFNDDRVIGLRNLVTERAVIGLRNLVTERAVIGQYDLIVERAKTLLLSNNHF